MLAVGTLIGSEAKNGEARAGAWCELGHLFYQWPAHPFWAWGQSPHCWSSSPEDQVHAVSVPSVCVLPAPSVGTFVLKGSSAGQEGLSERSACVGARARTAPAPVRVPVHSPSPASRSTKNGFPHLSRCCVGSALLCPLQPCSPLSWGSLCPSVELCHSGARGSGADTQLGLGHNWDLWEKLARVPDSFNLFLLPWFWKSAAVCAPFRSSLGSLQPCCLPHWFPN